MKRIVLVFAIYILFSYPAFGVESEITVLAVATGGANVGLAETQMHYLRDYWRGFGGVNIRLINNGAPIHLTTNVYTGSALQQLNSAVSHPDWGNYREAFAADIILIFTGQVSDENLCGLAVQHNWTKISNNTPGVFDPLPSSGLDLHGAENSYYAIVATGSKYSCDDYTHTGAHEFGHLLGAGHTKHALTQGAYLFGDSHAYAEIININDPFIGTFTIGYKTIVAEDSPPVCSNAGMTCVTASVYSQKLSEADNQRTLGITAKSVANYRVTDPGGGSGGSGGCTLSAPTFVIGNLVNRCNSNFWTQHEVSWAGGCPSQTSHYQLWYQQPAGSGGGYVYGWNVSNITSPVYVRGADSRIKIKACNGAQCSPLSIDSYLAGYEC